MKKICCIILSMSLLCFIFIGCANSEDAIKTIEEIKNTAEISVSDAYDKLAQYNSNNAEIADYRQELLELKNCEGTYSQDGKYEAKIEIQLKYGEYWMNIEYDNYTGTIDEAKLEKDGQDGFLYKARTEGIHVNIFGNIGQPEFEIRLSQEKLYISWGGGHYYLTKI